MLYRLDYVDSLLSDILHLLSCYTGTETLLLQFYGDLTRPISMGTASSIDVIHNPTMAFLARPLVHTYFAFIGWTIA